MSDSELYSRLLFPKKQGYPLFHPQPFDDLPETTRRNGTKIGDVGLITQDGFFDPIFNILCARDDPYNRFGVPVSFEQVLLGPNDIATSAQVYPPGSHISNTTISKRRLDVEAGVENVFLPFGAGAVVEVSTNSKETGLLLLPDGASRWDLRRQQVFRDYALKHAHNWYTFVNGDLQRMAGNGDLYLVTGVTKSTSWSVAALENHSGEGKISLKLKAAQMGNAGAACAWEWESADSSVNSGPRRCPGEEDWRDNQTVFLRGFKVALRSTPLRRAPKIKTVVNSKWSDMSSKGSFIPFSQSQSSTAGTVVPNSQPQSSGNNVNCLDRVPSSMTSSTESTTDDDESLRSSNCYHPSALINEHLLDCVVDATVAVTHDDEWASVLSEEDSEVPDHHELIRRISNKFQMSIVCGGVCLESLDSDLDSLSAPAIQQTTHLDNSADSRRIRFTPLPDPKRSVLLSDDGDGLPLPAAVYTAVPPPSPMPSRSPLPPKLRPSPDASQPMVGSAETKPAWRTALGGWGSTKGSSLTRTQSQTSTASTPTPKIRRWSLFGTKDGDDKDIYSHSAPVPSAHYPPKFPTPYPSVVPSSAHMSSVNEERRSGSRTPNGHDGPRSRSGTARQLSPASSTSSFTGSNGSGSTYYLVPSGRQKVHVIHTPDVSPYTASSSTQSPTSPHSQSSIKKPALFQRLLGFAEKRLFSSSGGSSRGSSRGGRRLHRRHSIGGSRRSRSTPPRE